MATRVIDGKRFILRQVSKKHTTPVHSSTNELHPKQSETSETHVTHTVVAPKTRLVVVRTTSTTKNEKGEAIKTDEDVPPKPIELPPALTDGRTSVYLIRRPIPPETPRPTQLFHRDNYDELSATTTKTTTTTTTKNRQNTYSPLESQEIVDSYDLLSEDYSSPQHSSPTELRNSRRRIRRSRSNSRDRSRSVKQRISPATEEEPKGFFSFSQTQTKGIQANVSSPEPVELEQSTTQLVSTRRSRGKKSTTPTPITSANSIVLVHPQEQTIAVIENSYSKNGTIVKQHSKHLQRIRHQQNMENQSTEKLVETSRWHRCLGCLSKHMCLIIIICLILCLIGLAGVGVSTYFFIIDSKDNFVRTVIGIAIGGALVIAAICFLCCILCCIGCHEGYFTYTGNNPRIGGRTFYLSSEKYEIDQKSVPIKQRQRIVRSKNVTIEMPERLLTGRQMSQKTHEHRLNKVVHNIERVVKQAKKRYPDDTPTKVIVKIDENAKATI